jgi:prepilin-type N-terminal cleavage/methylation domain-containing protein
MLNSKSKGFTMIELLVVIGIIGILAVIIMTSVSGSKNKSNDAKVKQQMANLKRTAEIYGSINNGNYGSATGNCTTATGLFVDTVSDVSRFVTVANYPSGTTLACYSSSTAWAASALLSSGQYWCVDSDGKVKQQASAVTTTACS